MLKKTSYNLLKKIVDSNERDIERLCYLVKKEKKQFWYELSLLNKELSENYDVRIESHNSTLIIEEKLEGTLKKILSHQLLSLYEYQNERIFILYLYIASKEEYLSTIHFQELFELSRNAIMLDLRKLRQWTSYCNVSVSYTRSKGYDLVGDEREIRKLMEESISKLKETIPLESLVNLYQSVWKNHLSIDFLYEKITQTLKKYKIKIVYDRMEEFVYLLLFISKRKNYSQLIYSDQEKDLLNSHPLYQISKDINNSLFDNNGKSEIFFIESRLLGIIQGENLEPKLAYFTRLVNSILSHLQGMISINSGIITDLRKTLFQHIIPAYYRIFFDVYYSNPLLEKIKNDYYELFELTKIILKPLEKEMGIEISESEIAYFTIHFGGYLENSRVEERQNLKAVVVCPNGISSSLIMSTTIRDTFPEITIINSNNLDDISDIDEGSYEIVFTTTYVSTNKKMYIMSPILNPIEKDILRERVSKDFPQITKSQMVKTRELLQIIERHARIEDRDNLVNEINNYIYRKDSINERKMKTLPELLDKSLIKISNKSLTWREAIHEASLNLLEQNYINEDYIQAMIETVENIGPYIVLAPRVAVPHARPERGVNKLGISLLKLNQEVDFNVNGEEDPDRHVRLIFVLAAVDGEAHLKALTQLAKILDNEDYINQLISSNDVEDLYSKINQFIEEGG